MQPILLMMPCWELGGAERQFRYLYNGLNKNQYKVIILLTNSTFSNEHEHIYSGNPKNQDSFIIQELLLLKAILNLKIKYKFKKSIIYDMRGQFLIPFLKIMGIKVLYSERNSGEHKHLISRLLISISDTIAANSITAQASMQHYITRRKIIYIPNGIQINKELMLSKYEKKSDDPFKIIVPARIDLIKNQLLIITALYKFANIEVHFAGEIVDKEYFDQLIEEINKFSLQKKFIYDGFIQNMELYYENFDLVILPSLSEGTSNIILESYVNQILCLASDIEMNKNVILFESMLFKSQCADALKDKVTHIMKMDISEKNKIIEANYRYVVGNYSIKKMIASYEALLNNI